MLDVAPIAATIRHLITAGTTEQQLLAAVARRFPELSPRDFVAALQDALEEAQRRVVRRH
jgi:hypothetical protein